MEFKVIQITKINTVDFKFTDTENLTLPVPPLASANHFTNKDGEDILKICATIYINSKDSKTPVVGSLSEDGNIFEIYFDYDWDDASPETYDVWSVEIDYTSTTVGNITQVISYLKNLNSTIIVGGGLGEEPKISRGTKTSSGD